MATRRVSATRLHSCVGATGPTVLGAISAFAVAAFVRVVVAETRPYRETAGNDERPLQWDPPSPRQSSGLVGVSAITARSAETVAPQYAAGASRTFTPEA
jgi:hypothetical protein